MSRQFNTPRRKKKRRLKKRAFIILFFLLVFIAGGGYFTYLYVKAGSTISASYENDGRGKSALRDAKVNPIDDNISVLIIGVDASEKRNNKSNNNSRSDTLMLATLNVKDKSIKLLSIPRDSYVYIPEVGYKTKINHAHAYGGPKASMETVEDLLNVPVDYYVKVNFDAFMDVVNAIDGIDVDVPYEMFEQDSSDKANAIHLLPGKQKLNGEEALAFARTRKQDSDIQRGQRQQEVIKAVFHKAISLGSIFKFDDIIEAVGANMTTNMRFGEMRSLIQYGLTNKGLNFDTLSLEGHDYQPAGTYFWQLDEESLAETQHILRKHLGLDTSADGIEDDLSPDDDNGTMPDNDTGTNTVPDNEYDDQTDNNW